MDVRGYVESNARAFIQIYAPNESVDLSLPLRGAGASAYLCDELAAADLG